MSRLQSVLSGFVVFIVSFVVLLVPSQAVLADAKSAVCDGAGFVVGSNCGSTTGTPEVESVVQRGLNIFSAILGIIAVVMFMLGGLKYMTAQGDSGQLNSAKNTLIFAAVGLVVVMLAQTIVKFVLERFAK